MSTRTALLSSIVFWLLMVSGCASTAPSRGAGGELVGAWIVTASRPAGVGRNLLTFSSDGTFFRSGDTHPTLSGGHGTWRRTPDGEFEATYVAFRFDENRKWIGSNKTRLRIKPGPGQGEFSGVARVVNRDLDDKEISSSETRLQGRRIEVEPL